MADEAHGVVVADEQDAVVVDSPRWGALAEAALADLGAVGELTLTFVDIDEIGALNAEFMGASGPTDVLAFPIDADDTAREPRPPSAAGSPPRLLGDVVICPEVARDQAPEHAGCLDDELALLVVHGILHIVGHDHATPDEADVMRSLERHLLETLHWHGPTPVGFSFDHR